MFAKLSVVGKCGIFITLYTLFAANNAQFQGESLKFKLSAVNLPNADLDGPSDPYVKLFTSVSRQGERHRHWEKFGETSVKYDTLNPIWDETFVYQYINGTDQRWRFLVKDLDNGWFNPIDDHLGRIELNVEDYIVQMRNSRQNQTGAGSQSQKAIQMFLTEPLGGALLVTPIWN